MGRPMESSSSARYMALVLPAFVAILFLLINPAGFMGGGGDDYRYLTAARCWVDGSGFCLPRNHWEARWPTVMPIAAMLGLFGESRNTLGIAPLLFWISALVLIGWLGRLWFDRATGLVAAALFSAVPIFTLSALQPNADNVELVFQLGALCLATVAYKRQSRWSALSAGLLAAFACQARETSFIFCLVTALSWFTLPREHRRILLYAIPGFVAGIAAEMLIYAISTGDAALRYRLALNHSAVYSTELAPTVDTARSALLNPDFIAGWKREMGIHIWWPIDPWLNLLASPQLGTFVILAGAMAILVRKDVPSPWKNHLKWAAVFTALAAALLVYVLAVDPKSRMFLLIAVVATLTSAATLVTAWRNSRRVLAACVFALICLVAVPTMKSRANPRPFEVSARQWIGMYGAAIEIDRATQTVLTLIPEADRLPLQGSGKPMVLAIGGRGCRQLVQPQAGSSQLAHVVKTAGDEGTAQLCLLKYSDAGRAAFTRRSIVVP